MLDAVVHGNDEDQLAELLSRRCSCDVIRSRDVTSSFRCVSDVAGVVLVHSPVARQLYDVWCGGTSFPTSVDVFTTVVSDLMSQWRSQGADSGALAPVYHVSFLNDSPLYNNDHIIQYETFTLKASTK